ncbi:hypothetical protein P1P68_17555 [Streptomyces scabiei]|uniref:hypothetical protein n=1 Tax=Streptomyces scabiei TaxID=1930 RepID=UPI00298F4BBF|nr:hypothetical protein [Streptomyces scabiei]MDW8806548.1 hypothetical protein [Streptomyces scabiei]
MRIHDHDINERDLTVLLDRIGEDMTRWDGTFEYAPRRTCSHRRIFGDATPPKIRYS